MGTVCADEGASLPSHQRVLLAHKLGPNESYQITEQWPLPQFKNPNEVLIRVGSVSLNAVDWKCMAFGFGVPTLPAITGRDLAGTVVRVGSGVSRIRVGDRVYGPSTQYRDYRMSAFQEYAIAFDHCLGHVPEDHLLESWAAVAFRGSWVTASLAVGSALGIPIRDYAPRDLSIGAEGEQPGLKSLDPVAFKGQYLLIWGGEFFPNIPPGPVRLSDLSATQASTVTGFMVAQFAIISGLKVIAVVHEAKHGQRMRDLGVHHIVDRTNPSTAISDVKAITSGSLRYAMDCVGRETASHALATLGHGEDSWLVCLSGKPKAAPANVHLLEVPIKTFHTNPAVGRATMNLLGDLFSKHELIPPPIEVLSGGLEAINGGVQRLRTGDHGFGRLVVRMN